jgi:bisanhydrobacterioruberin hydratase
MLDSLVRYKAHLAVGIVWLFHISALIGVSLGHLDWFISKTPLNLMVCLLLFLLVYPLDTVKKIMAFAVFFGGGMFAEWLGVNYGILFGAYEYGENFGPKWDGVPLLIGAYWALLTFITAALMDYTALNSWTKAFLAAVLMVVLDYFMEHSAPHFDFWTFEGGYAPLENYVTWFLLALLFQAILRWMDLRGNKTISLHLYLAQLLFFLFFYF